MPRPANVQLVIDALTRKALTIPALTRATGLSQPCALQIVRLLKSERRAYIAEWHQVDAGAMYRRVAAYRYGEGEDQIRPPLQTIEEKRAKNRLYRKRSTERKLLALEEAMETEDRERILQELARPAFRDPFVAALFGEYQGAGA